MSANADLHIIECPRDAMQGLEKFIPTEHKVAYLNTLLQVGFNTQDPGSLVSPKAIPQMRDSREVLEQLDYPSDLRRVLTIVANERGAREAAAIDPITHLGYPFSVSETFQKRNTNKSIAESQELVRRLLDIAQAAHKELVVYVSMGFGNPYREPWSGDIVLRFCEKLINMGVKTISLSDTIGTSNPASISHLFETLIPAFPQTEFGAHLHTTQDSWFEKVDAAYKAGCRRFDGAIQGFGGCPMATDDLVGNMPTEMLVQYAVDQKIPLHIDQEAFREAYFHAQEVFPDH